MNQRGLDFFRPTKIYGNDILSLIHTYAEQIFNLDADSKGNFSKSQVKAFLIAYVTARNSLVFASFKNRDLGKTLLSIFMDELAGAFDDSDEPEAVSNLANAFNKQLVADPKNFNKYVIDIYIEASKGTATSDELILVRNFMRAIQNIDESCNRAAENFGFF